MNEEELEKIREVKDRLENKKHLTSYERGQLDLIKDLRKEQPKTRLEKISVFVVGCLVLSTFALLFYSIYADIMDGSFAIERAGERWAKDDEDYCCSKVIDKNKGFFY